MFGAFGRQPLEGAEERARAAGMTDAWLSRALAANSTYAPTDGSPFLRQMEANAAAALWLQSPYARRAHE